MKELIRTVEALRDEAAERWNTDPGIFSKDYWNGKRDAYDNVLHLLRDAREGA